MKPHLAKGTPLLSLLTSLYSLVNKLLVQVQGSLVDDHGDPLLPGLQEAAAPGGPSVSSGGSWLRCAGKPVVRSMERTWDGDRKARSSLPGWSRCPRPRLPKIRQKQN